MVTKEEAKKKVEELVEDFNSIPKEDLDKKSENQIQSEFIDPLFEALGWDMKKDAEREENVHGGRTDYIIRLPSGAYPAACCDNFKKLIN